jgi:hypothetical protein
MARFRAARSRIRFRKRNDFGVASSTPMLFNRALQIHAQRRFELNPFAFVLVRQV